MEIPKIEYNCDIDDTSDINLDVSPKPSKNQHIALLKDLKFGLDLYQNSDDESDDGQLN